MQENQHINQIEQMQNLQWFMDVGVDEAINETITDYAWLAEDHKRQAIEKKKAKAEEIQQLAEQNKASAKAGQQKEQSQSDEYYGLIPNKPDAAVGTMEAVMDAEEAVKNCRTLEELKKTLNEFEGCSLKRTATNLVFAQGSSEARIMLIGEVPSASDDRQGKVFSGEDGQFLDKMLQSIGIDRSSLYLTYIANWRPPGNRVISKAEISVCLPFIRRHIELVNPDILIILGGVASKTLLDTTQSITQLRGKWAEYTALETQKKISVIPLFNPAFLRASPEKKALMWKDLQSIQAKFLSISH